MNPAKRGADYAAIERRAHELRREAMDGLLTELFAWIGSKLRVVQDVAASVRLRQIRNADRSFFEAN